VEIRRPAFPRVVGASLVSNLERWMLDAPSPVVPVRVTSTEYGTLWNLEHAITRTVSRITYCTLYTVQYQGHLMFTVLYTVWFGSARSHVTVRRVLLESEVISYSTVQHDTVRLYVVCAKF
jgi:hypothetical protein